MRDKVFPRDLKKQKNSFNLYIDDKSYEFERFVYPVDEKNYDLSKQKHEEDGVYVVYRLRNLDTKNVSAFVMIPLGCYAAIDNMLKITELGETTAINIGVGEITHYSYKDKFGTLRIVNGELRGETSVENNKLFSFLLEHINDDAIEFGVDRVNILVNLHDANKAHLNKEQIDFQNTAKKFRKDFFIKGTEDCKYVKVDATKVHKAYNELYRAPVHETEEEQTAQENKQWENLAGDGLSDSTFEDER